MGFLVFRARRHVELAPVTERRAPALVHAQLDFTENSATNDVKRAVSITGANE